MKRTFSISILAFLAAGCAATAGAVNTTGVRLSEVQPVRPVSRREIVVDISKDELDRALVTTASRAFRLVPTFAASATAGAAAAPEYRMFGIKPSSAYALMGLENGDILVAANDYVVYNPAGFVQYVAIMKTQQDPHIEIRRGNEPIVLRFRLH